MTDLKQQVDSPSNTTTPAVVVENVNSSTLPDTKVITHLQPVTPVAVSTGTVNSSDLVVNVNPSRTCVSFTQSHSELPIPCSIVDGQCLPITDIGHSSGFTIVIDNWDMRQEVRNMLAEHQNIDIHWVNCNIVENWVSGNHIPDDKPIRDLFYFLWLITKHCIIIMRLLQYLAVLLVFRPCKHRSQVGRPL